MYLSISKIFIIYPWNFSSWIFKIRYIWSLFATYEYIFYYQWTYSQEIFFHLYHQCFFQILLLLKFWNLSHKKFSLRIIFPEVIKRWVKDLWSMVNTINFPTSLRKQYRYIGLKVIFNLIYQRVFGKNLQRISYFQSVIQNEAKDNCYKTDYFKPFITIFIIQSSLIKYYK